MPRRNAEDRSDTSRDLSSSPAAVYVCFEPAAGQRLRRPEPTSCPGEPPLWVERPILMKRKDGSYELIGTTRNLEGLARWVLSFGTNAKVHGPDQLQRRVAIEARKVWRRYDI